MQRISARLFAIGTTLFASAVSFAEGPSIADVLAIKATQTDVTIDTPDEATFAKCRLEVSKKPSGWNLWDSRGMLVRKFVDSNADGAVDQWSFYQNGQEIYRDIDTDFDGKPDQCRWLRSGGSRWGIDTNQDGKIDQWKSISAEEATREAVQAIVTNDIKRLRLVLLSTEDLKTLKADEATVERVSKAQSKLETTFQDLASSLPRGSKWSRFDGHTPVAIPGTEIGSSVDLLIYYNGTVMIEGGEQSQYFRAAEIVRVGDAWKLVDLPALVSANQTINSGIVLAPSLDQQVVASASSTGGKEGDQALVENNEKIQEYADLLKKLDENQPNANDQKALVAYYNKRTEYCAFIGSKSKKQENREYWYKQTADSINSAVQTEQYPQGVEVLNQYADQFDKLDWGAKLGSYFRFRAINSNIALKLSKEKDHSKVQQELVEQLIKFVDTYPKSEDADDALWQIGNGQELATNKDDQAIQTYKRLKSEHPDSKLAEKADGAIRRLESVGQPFQLSGKSLAGNGNISSADLNGNVYLVTYWATWCDPVKVELPKLQKIRDKFHDRGFEILGICLDNDPSTATGFVKENGINWPNLIEEGGMNSPLAVKYGIVSLPYLMIVDADGRVVKKNLGFAQIESEIESIMAKKLASKKQ